MSDYHYLTSKTGNYPLLLAKAKGHRRMPTEAEERLWRYLRGNQLGVRFRRQHPIDNYIADFVCLRKWLVIEVDGGCHKDKEHAEADKKRTSILNEIGFEVVRFSNDEVLAETEEVVRKIKEKVEAKE